MAKPNATFRANAIDKDGNKSSKLLKFRQYETTDVPKTFVVRVDEMVDEESGEVIGIYLNNSNLDLHSKHRVEWFNETFKGFRRRTKSGEVRLVLELYIEEGLDLKSATEDVEYF